VLTEGVTERGLVAAIEALRQEVPDTEEDELLVPVDAVTG
jgi:hypothetical protein